LPARGRVILSPAGEEEIMIEMLEGFPEGVVAGVAKGRVTRRDYEEILVPAVEAAFQRQSKVRCYYELGRDFAGMDAGAVWEDLRVGLGHLSGWERVAVVTDVDWVRFAVNAFRFLLPGEVRVFPTSAAGDARRWIAAGLN
jgi:SpoIIAA-like